MSTDTAETPQFKFRFFPVLVTVFLGFGIPYLAAEILDQLRHYSRLVPGIADQLGRLYAQHAVLMLLAASAVPASMTMALGLSRSAVMSFGWPTAEITTSACWHNSAGVATCRAPASTSGAHLAGLRFHTVSG